MKNPETEGGATCVGRGCACLLDRVGDLRVWARSRIATCRQQEQKFKASDVAIEAATERRSIETVLRILDGEG